MGFNSAFKGLNANLNPICLVLALLGAHHILHVSRIRVNGIQRYSHSSTCSRNFKAAHIDRIVTLEWQILVGDGDWPGWLRCSYMFVFGFRWLRDVACSGLESAKRRYFNRLLMLFVELRNGASERNSNVVRSLREIRNFKAQATWQFWSALRFEAGTSDKRYSKM